MSPAAYGRGATGMLAAIRDCRIAARPAAGRGDATRRVRRVDGVVRPGARTRLVPRVSQRDRPARRRRPGPLDESDPRSSCRPAAAARPAARRAATAFQWQVWTALAAIPYGETRSYAEVAAAIGRPAAARAVARACATNPVALAIPCHRVVPSAGGPGGYRWGAAERRPFWPLSIEYEVDDSLRPRAFPRSVSPFARALVSTALRATEQRSRRHWRRADRVRGGLRVCGRRHSGHARRGRPSGRRRHAGRARLDLRGSRRAASSTSRSSSACEAARHAFQAWRRAALDFSALLRRLDIQCHLEPHSALTVAFTPEQIARLKKEQKARVDAGLEAPALTARAVSGEVALSAAFGLRGARRRDDRSLSRVPGLAKAAAERGARIFERSPMKRITFNRKTADVHHRRAASFARARVVVATAMPSGVFQSLARHFWFRTSYLALTEPVPARIRRRTRQATDRRPRLGRIRRTSFAGWTTSACSWRELTPKRRRSV